MAETRPDKLVKLSAALPSHDRENGIDHLAELIAENPKGTLVFAVAILDAKKVDEDIDADTRIPLMRVREIEAVPLDAADPGLVRTIVEWREARRGPEAEQDTLPDAPLDDHLGDDEDDYDDDEPLEGAVVFAFGGADS